MPIAKIVYIVQRHVREKTVHLDTV